MDRRVVLISGGSRGLGAEMVTAFLEAGDVVATFSRRPTKFVEELQEGEFGDRFEYRPLDLSDLGGLKAFAKDLHEKHGRLDVLINNAAVAHEGVLATTADEQVRRQIDINLTATLLLTKYCVRFMILEPGGRVINISSILGLRGFSGLVTYSATKAGLMGMTRSLARELGKRSITVNTVAPGYLETEMSAGLDPKQRKQIVRRTPLGRLGQSKDVVPLVEFLASDGGGFITGQVITVDGGATN